MHFCFVGGFLFQSTSSDPAHWAGERLGVFSISIAVQRKHDMCFINA